MAFPTFDQGTTFFTVRRDAWTRDDYSTFTVPMELLPTRVAPLDKQLRIAIGGTEYTFNRQDNGLDQPTSNYFTISQPGAASAAVPCWGVRFDVSVATPTEDVRVAEVSVWDENGDVIDIKADWVEDSTYADCVDDDVTTRRLNSSATDSIEIRFPRQMLISKMGWTGGVGVDDDAEEVEIYLNTGNLSTPEWTLAASRTDIDPGDYPSLSNPYNPDTMTLQETPSSSLFGRTPEPVITVEPAPSSDNDRIIFWRETRQDQPWVYPTNAARARSFDVYWFYKQMLFILQELCELDEVGSYLPLPIADRPVNDYTSGNQSVVHAGGGTTLSYSTIELLTGIPGAPADVVDRDQIIVERGDQTDGSSTEWVTLTFSAAPSDETEYSVDESAKTVTLGAAEDNDVRIRRTTRLDDLWVDYRTDQPNWNSAFLGLIQKQIKFLIEEACFLPSFYNDSILGNSIFPRAWNWLVFTGGGNNFNIGGPYWGGDGSIFVFDNDLELSEGTDYYIEFPNIFIPDGANGDVDIGFGGGGWGGIDFGGGDSDEEEPDNPVPPPSEPQPPIDWPGFILDDDPGISVSISSVPVGNLISGDWEGSGINAGFANEGFGTSPHVIRIELAVTLTNTIPDSGGGGFYPVGAKEVIYISRVCGSEADAVEWNIAVASDADADGTFEYTDEGSFALLCADPGGADTSLNLWVEALTSGLSVDSTFPPQFRFWSSLANISGALAQGDITNVPFYRQWLELTENSINALGEGVVSESGFSWDQFQQYLDPFQDFEDFDLP